ncbi:MAG: type II toxin-antitoxin system RelE/ParE family toxin [Candidatus Omnitrophota bacterium]
MDIDRVSPLNYSCFYFTTRSGRSPVEEFINSLDYRSQRKFFFKKGLLEEFGEKLPYPHSRYIGDDIYELRFHSREGTIRALYFFFNKNKIIFTNGFLKKSNRAPKREKKLAIERRRVFLSRVGD